MLNLISYGITRYGKGLFLNLNFILESLSWNMCFANCMGIFMAFLELLCILPYSVYCCVTLCDGK